MLRGQVPNKKIKAKKKKKSVSQRTADVGIVERGVVERKEEREMEQCFCI